MQDPVVERRAFDLDVVERARKLFDEVIVAVAHNDEKQPLFLLHVEYNDEFFRIGYLEEGLRLEPGRDSAGREKWLGGASPTELGEVTLDVTKLADTLRANAKRIARARVWLDPKLRLSGELPAERGEWPAGVGGAA